MLAELGHGGMADVFLAVAQGPEGLGFTKLVVIKRLRENLADDPEFIAMLVDEARIAARLNHPNAVQTYEISQVGSDYFIAMEYLDGQPLNRIENRGKRENKQIPLAYAISILADVCAGLHHAHELLNYDGTPLGVVHRDVSPHNVFVTYDGQVKVVDFGIAKAIGRASETKSGTVKGKVVYMAPEQASGQSVDRRADIFSVGVMMYEVLTGVRMWRGHDEHGVMARLITRDLPGPPSSVVPTIDPKLDAICARALAPRVADRFETAEAMATALLEYLNAKGERPLQRDLGQFVAELFADRRRETREVIDAQLQAMERDSTFKIRALTGADSGKTPSGDRESTPRKLDVPIPVEHEPETANAALLAAPTRVAVERPRKTSGASQPMTLSASDVSSPEPERRSRPVLKTMIAAVVLIGLGGSAYGYLRARGALDVERSQLPLASATAPVSAPAESSSTAPADGTITLSLYSDVPSAVFRIDGAPPVPSPYATRVKKDDRTHVVVASAPNQEDARFEVRFDADVTWAPTFKPKPVASAATSVPTSVAAVAKRPPVGVSPPGRSTQTAPPPDPTPATATATTRVEPPKPRRTLDDDNPYEKKKSP
jgi:serine/threonine-protein kinase